MNSVKSRKKPLCWVTGQSCYQLVSSSHTVPLVRGPTE
jgi:hypothetical protein